LINRDKEWSVESSRWHFYLFIFLHFYLLIFFSFFQIRVDKLLHFYLFIFFPNPQWKKSFLHKIQAFYCKSSHASAQFQMANHWLSWPVSGCVIV
jgi:hypothetical protein